MASAADTSFAPARTATRMPLATFFGTVSRDSVVADRPRMASSSSPILRSGTLCCAERFRPQPHATSSVSTLKWMSRVANEVRSSEPRRVTIRWAAFA